MLKRISQNRTVPECVSNLVEKISTFSQISIGAIELADIRSQFSLLFEEWIRVFSHPSSNENIQSVFIQQLLNQGILDDDEIASLFYRTFIETVFEKFNTESIVPNMPSNVAYAPIDSLARFVTLIIKLTPVDTVGTNSRIRLVTKILSINLMVMVNIHESEKQEFNQKPFFRFFTSLLTNLHAQEEALNPNFFHIMTAIRFTYRLSYLIF